MFESEVVVFGCGNILFGDDGLAPRVVADLARRAQAEREARDAALARMRAHVQGQALAEDACGYFIEEEATPSVAYIDAGTSIRTLLTDLALMGARPRRVIVLDVVQEPGRAPGSIRREDLDARRDGDMAGGFWHHAPTWGLLRRLRDELESEVMVVTVQAARIPELMDDALSPEAQAAAPRLTALVRALCHPQYLEAG